MSRNRAPPVAAALSGPFVFPKDLMVKALDAVELAVPPAAVILIDIIIIIIITFSVFASAIIMIMITDAALRRSSSFAAALRRAAASPRRRHGYVAVREVGLGLEDFFVDIRSTIFLTRPNASEPAPHEVSAFPTELRLRCSSSSTIFGSTLLVHLLRSRLLRPFRAFLQRRRQFCNRRRLFRKFGRL